MSHRHHNIRTDAGTGTPGAYIGGLILAILLTVAAFAAVMARPFRPGIDLGIIITAAVMQMLVHAHFFLHLSRKTTPRANLILFAFTGTVVFLLVSGSLWIMIAGQANMAPGSMTMP